MTTFIDRRLDTLNQKDKTAVNRQRFIRRYKKQIREKVANSIDKRGISDVYHGEKISISGKDLQEHTFGNGPHGVFETIYAGNKQFITGDHIQRPSQNSGSAVGEQASASGEGTDEFSFELTKEEFLDMFFEDLALPDLERKRIIKMLTTKHIRAGHTKDGTPNNINIARSLQQACARRITLSKQYKAKLATKENMLADYLQSANASSDSQTQLRAEIDELKQKIENIPFIDPFDLRYHYRIKQQIPSTQAVMFCIMDVSGSMDRLKKDIAKRFFILLYLFLHRNYQKIDIVFIRHHTSAKEVDEQEFFYSRETGGTVVSSAIDLMQKMIHERYLSDYWNIYAAQASDGDNWNADSPRCQQLLERDILPYVQYYAYVEIMPRHHQSLWQSYLHLANTHNHFAMQHIHELADIYPVFRELFKKENV